MPIKVRQNGSWVTVADKGQKGEKGLKGDYGEIGGQGDKAGLRYKFSTSTTMEDPGGGIFRYNNGTLVNISKIAIDATTSEGTDLSNYIGTWEDSTNDTIKGHIIVQSNVNSDDTYTIFEVTGLTDYTGWLEISVQNAAGNIPDDNEECVINFSRAGNKGEKGEKGQKGDKGDKGLKGDFQKG